MNNFQKLLTFIPFDKYFKRIRRFIKENVTIEIGVSKRMKLDQTDGFIYEYYNKERKKGPFCPECWYNEHDRIPLSKTPTPNVYYCNKCKKYKRSAYYKEPVDEDLNNFINYTGF